MLVIRSLKAQLCVGVVNVADFVRVMVVPQRSIP